MGYSLCNKVVLLIKDGFLFSLPSTFCSKYSSKGLNFHLQRLLNLKHILMHVQIMEIEVIDKVVFDSLGNLKEVIET